MTNVQYKVCQNEVTFQGAADQYKPIDAFHRRSVIILWAACCVLTIYSSFHAIFHKDLFTPIVLVALAKLLLHLIQTFSQLGFDDRVPCVFYFRVPTVYVFTISLLMISVTCISYRCYDNDAIISLSSNVANRNHKESSFENLGNKTDESMLWDILDTLSVCQTLAGVIGDGELNSSRVRKFNCTTYNEMCCINLTDSYVICEVSTLADKAISKKDSNFTLLKSSFQKESPSCDKCPTTAPCVQNTEASSATTVTNTKVINATTQICPPPCTTNMTSLNEPCINLRPCPPTEKPKLCTTIAPITPSPPCPTPRACNTSMITPTPCPACPTITCPTTTIQPPTTLKRTTTTTTTTTSTTTKKPTTIPCPVCPSLNCPTTTMQPPTTLERSKTSSTTTTTRPTPMIVCPRVRCPSQISCPSQKKCPTCVPSIICPVCSNCPRCQPTRCRPCPATIICPAATEFSSVQRPTSTALRPVLNETIKCPTFRQLDREFNTSGPIPTVKYFCDLITNKMSLSTRHHCYADRQNGTDYKKYGRQGEPYQKFCNRTLPQHEILRNQNFCHDNKNFITGNTSYYSNDPSDDELFRKCVENATFTGEIVSLLTFCLMLDEVIPNALANYCNYTYEGDSVKEEQFNLKYRRQNENRDEYCVRVKGMNHWQTLINCKKTFGIKQSKRP